MADTLPGRSHTALTRRCDEGVRTATVPFVRFLDLGPLAVEIDGAPRTLGGRRVESVAAALLVNVGTPLPAAALVDAVGE